MQISNIYSIYDRKAAYYLPVFNLRSDAEAIRSFADMIIQSDTPVSKYPADFDLVRLGTLDLERGLIEPEYPVGLLVNGLVCLQSANQERHKYQKAMQSSQVDIEELIAEQS